MRLTTVSRRVLSSRQRAPGMVRVAASRALRICCSRSPRPRTLAARNASTYAAPARGIATLPIGQNSVPARFVAGANSVEFQRDDFAVEHGHQPAHRTHELLTRLAPVHILGPVNRVDFLGKQLGQDFASHAAFLRYLRRQVFTFGSCDRSRCATSTPAFLGESMRGRSGLTILEGDVDRGAGNLLGDIGLRCWNSGGETARRRGVSRARDCSRWRRVVRAPAICARVRANPADAASIMRAGISSQPISSRKSGIDNSYHHFASNYSKQTTEPTRQPCSSSLFSLRICFATGSASFAWLTSRLLLIHPGSSQCPPLVPALARSRPRARSPKSRRGHREY